ncbi:cytochrome c-type biogenesis protein CcmH [Gammaproteobacteria bacterium]|nr:cytochrome c-type biogenesis protein CcmH [Gammaproteobacteria bacterium]
MKSCIKIYTKIIILLTIFIHTISLAAIDPYVFERPQDELRFQQLSAELRCPKCQNQNIADSNAPLSKDLKDRVYSMINDGRSDSEIMNFMVERYGDFVTYRPPIRPLTYILWFGPFIFGFLIILVIIVLRKKANKLSKHQPSISPLTANELKALNDLLK